MDELSDGSFISISSVPFLDFFSLMIITTVYCTSYLKYERCKIRARSCAELSLAAVPLLTGPGSSQGRDTLIREHSSKGKFVHGTYLPRDILSKGHMIKGTHRPGDASSKKKTFRDTSVGDTSSWHLEGVIWHFFSNGGGGGILSIVLVHLIIYSHRLNV